MNHFLDINQLNYIFNNPKLQLIFIVVSIWSLIWKGIALWRSAKNNQRNWFIALLLINSFGILEIIYLFYFNKPKKPQNVGENEPKA